MQHSNQSSVIGTFQRSRCGLMLALGCLLLAVGVQPLAAGTISLYATEFGSVPQRFYSVDPETGATTVIGETGTYSPGLDFRSEGELFGSSTSLYTIDLNTGMATSITTLPAFITSIAFNSQGELFGVDNGGDFLYQISPTTGAQINRVSITGTVFASTGNPLPGEINGIDFGPGDVLYGIGFGLYRLNASTGVASRITPSGQYAGSSSELFLDLDYGADGLLRAPTSSFGRLYEIDPSTGLGTLVGSGGNLRGIASSGPVVPEPSSFVLFGIGITGLVVVRRRRRRA